MLCRTWEEAAHDATLPVPNPFPPATGSFLGAIEKVLTDLRDDGGGTAVQFMWLASDALGGYNEITGAKVKGALPHVEATIISKQHDYGHDNILWGGVQGIVLRMHDKAARIRNLEKRRHAEHDHNGGPINESLADSWLDLVGYSIIGIMLVDGTFELPLSTDLEKK